MPSNASGAFRYNRVDVYRLIDAYEELRPTGSGKRGLGHLTRASVVTLCAAWEQYVEDAMIEAVEHLIAGSAAPRDLPMPVQRWLSRQVREAKNTLKPLEMAGDGWREVYRSYVQRAATDNHSPKTANIEKLWLDSIGIEQSVCDTWSYSKKDINEFVQLRNEIAHKGRGAAHYVKFSWVKYYLDMISEVVRESDNFLGDQLTAHLGNRPWRRRN
tara:strand:+ start:294 stop:938 length:645 start_codon:yes stop_codon:yes gene_type:complete